MAEIPSTNPTHILSEPPEPRKSSPGSFSKIARVIGLGALLAVAPPGVANAQQDPAVEVSDKDTKSIEAAKAHVVKLAEQKGKRVEFGKAEIYRKGDPDFDSAIKLIQNNPNDYPNNKYLDEKSVACIVSLGVTKENGHLEYIVIALGSNDELLGLAD
ncbi:MAG: hypothetical protein ACD_51C00250G0001 [uncultured bacterium]|uniref:Uncharacterized protein n=1 Tax=candidate division WOR-1 bacterium RIFOXYC2_FULL_41_25 TaxID=1802586 RepID=A0A1F4TL84_UNCSA|nr:MAG: hypothetical protein ACD_51C00250G0001 [uncultured bacterium]OGC33339.1 MAG: hypothetical protein A2462_08860 [candidate division WOR-1 bacterium RIFOXYC2_FULL_41_25]OGJ47622.1 MAG: hypothetical protein A2244_00980 [Candidatus Peregrinibacteria bacterium RIFOXYA2_FULL_41_18]